MSDLPHNRIADPTRYHLFDGFRESGIVMKVVYIASAFTGMGIVIPAAMEAFAYGKAVQARTTTYAQEAAAATLPPVAPAASLSADSSAPLIIPEPDAASRYQDAVARKRLEQETSRQM